MLKSIREEPPVLEALKASSNAFPRVWDAYEALCWVLARRQLAGTDMPGIRDVYHLHKQAEGGWGVPALTVIYTVGDEIISLWALRVSEA